MNIAAELARHLEFLGFGELDESVFWGLMPTNPDTAVCVYSSDSQYAGSAEGARLQIVTRSSSTNSAYDLSQAIAEELAEYSGYLGGDGPFVSIDLTNASAGLGDDERHRAMFSTNVVVKYCDCDC